MIDTHCHINDELYLNNPKDYIDEAMLAKVDKFLVVGYDLKSSKEAVKIAEKFENVYAAVGIHPSEVKKMKENDLYEIELLLSNNRVIAVGEIGLDFYWDKDEEVKKQQEEFFIKQIDLANKFDLPVSIHCREATEACLKILKEHPVNRKGIQHCFAGSLEVAKEYSKMGWLIGIGGVVTFKNAVKMKDVAQNIDIKNIVLETDAPYLAPTPHRGEANHSKYLYLIRDEIAKLRGVSPKEIEENTTSNFERIFKI